MIPVIWLSFDDTPARCRWDQNIVDVICPVPYFEHITTTANLPHYDGAVVVFAAGNNEKFIPDLNTFLRKFDWVVLVLTSDEQSTFPWHNVHHPNIRIWTQYPRPDRHRAPIIRKFPIGAPSAHRHIGMPVPAIKNIDIFFSGQVTHLQRELMAEAFQHSELDFSINATEGFTEGVPQAEYMELLARSKVALCPTGPCSPDSFRTWEALEMGAVPIVDQGPRPDELGRAVAGYPRGFWDLLGPVPFPVVDKWSDGPRVASSVLRAYPVPNNVYSAWWQQKKRSMRHQMLDDISELGGNYAGPINSNITVLVPTSPTPNNPESDHLYETITSVRDRLRNSEILLMMDGVRHEQSDRRTDYEEYRRRVLWNCNHRWPNVTPFYFTEHLHQAEMTRRVLEHVVTDYVLFVEHDTPLVGNIPWTEWIDWLNNGWDVIRTYHETVMQPEHLHLMEDQYGDYTQTHQWSQRPHMARTSWYAKTIELYFNEYSRTMLEDKLHGIAQDEPQNFKMLLYTPSGNIQRAGHLDARGEDPKFEMRF